LREGEALLYLVEWEAGVGWMKRFGGEVVNDGGYSIPYSDEWVDGG
jgi:hypothetical protein